MKEKIDEQNKYIWDSVIKKDVMLYPNERVVAFLARNYKDIENNKNGKKALDIGFGSGRHLKLLLDYGFETHGIDYNETCCETANKLLDGKANVSTTNLDDIEYKDFFDVVLMYGVAFLRDEKSMLEDLKRVNKFLKKDGKLLINFRTKDDYLYQKGKNIVGNTYILENVGVYDGLTYTFLSSKEAISLVKEAGFEVELIERDDYWKNNLKEQNTWWIITAKKL